jgi:hypothetical protein
MLRLKKFVLLPLVLLLVSLLGGCVRYDVGIDFRGQHHGTIVQHITLSDRLTALSQSEADKWLDSVDQRAKQLKGKAQRVSPKEIIVFIPFGNGQDLVKKFNQFYNPDTPIKSAEAENLDILQLQAKMAIKQNNWLLFERNRLELDVDLRALGILSNQGNIIISPGSLVDIDFGLQTPWGSRDLTTTAEQSENRAVWHLQPGEINHLDAVFWTPSFLGWGTLAIILLTIGGFIAKYGRLPGVPSLKA